MGSRIVCFDEDFVGAAKVKLLQNILLMYFNSVWPYCIVIHILK